MELSWFTTHQGKLWQGTQYVKKKNQPERQASFMIHSSDGLITKKRFTEAIIIV